MPMMCFELRILYSSCFAARVRQLNSHDPPRQACAGFCAPNPTVWPTRSFGGLCAEIVRIVYGRKPKRREEGVGAPYLTGRVHNLSREILPLKPDNLAECVLDRRVVALDEV